jgi:hypothetical protein
MSIKGNLDHALRRIRHKYAHQPIWIDAICIDQQNDKEKNQQVGMMPLIYSAALKVLVWFGEDSDHGDGRFIFRQCQPNTHGYITTSLTMETDDLQGFILLERLHLLSLIDKFDSRRYFERRWVVRELFYSQELYTKSILHVMCGQDEMTWCEFRLNMLIIARLFAKIDHPPSNAEALIDAVTNPWLMKHSISLGPSSYNPFSNLHACQHFECSDSRDRIFALQSLWERPRIRID